MTPCHYYYCTTRSSYSGQLVHKLASKPAPKLLLLLLLLAFSIHQTIIQRPFRLPVNYKLEIKHTFVLSGMCSPLSIDQTRSNCPSVKGCFKASANWNDSCHFIDRYIKISFKITPD
mgnify:CR=1 FL=1